MNAHATAADYAWLDEDLPGLTEAYCLTLVRGLTPRRYCAASGRGRSCGSPESRSWQRPHRTRGTSMRGSGCSSASPRSATGP
ncbi:DUF6461 domain-containing protein [Streptomyces decoyicus]|uniref:DUF6461 domain-containing protein n=1 Tax=Streptomyces decoyicus TaxID=249567 RepID=UPI0038659441